MIYMNDINEFPSIIKHQSILYSEIVITFEIRYFQKSSNFHIEKQFLSPHSTMVYSSRGGVRISGGLDLKRKK